jgi:hypothetical protein
MIKRWLRNDACQNASVGRTSVEWGAAVCRCDGGCAAQHETSVCGNNVRPALVCPLWRRRVASDTKILGNTTTPELALPMKVERSSVNVLLTRRLSARGQSLESLNLVPPTHFHMCDPVPLVCNVLRPILALRKFGCGAQDWRCILRLITRPQPNVG